MKKYTKILSRPSDLLKERPQPFRGFSSTTLGGIRKGPRKKENARVFFFHGGIMRREQRYGPTRCSA
jgi:hypothetical protein